MTINSKQIAIFCVDVGSQKNFGWASLCDGRTLQGCDIESLLKELVVAAHLTLPVAIGFECPLFIPCPSKHEFLGKGRQGEMGRPWGATAGALVALHGLQQMCWLLERLKEEWPGQPHATLSWNKLDKGDYRLLLWEAFVSGKTKTDSHTGDALAAATAFHNALPDPLKVSEITCDNAISLAGLALLWSGWTRDEQILHEETLVIRPSQRCN
jgi:hypothetical protein